MLLGAEWSAPRVIARAGHIRAFAALSWVRDLSQPSASDVGTCGLCGDPRRDRFCVRLFDHIASGSTQAPTMSCAADAGDSSDRELRRRANGQQAISYLVQHLMCVSPSSRQASALSCCPARLPRASDPPEPPRSRGCGCWLFRISPVGVAARWVARRTDVLVVARWSRSEAVWRGWRRELPDGGVCREPRGAWQVGASQTASPPPHSCWRRFANRDPGSSAISGFAQRKRLGC